MKTLNVFLIKSYFLFGFNYVKTAATFFFILLIPTVHVQWLKLYYLCEASAVPLMRTIEHNTTSQFCNKGNMQMDIFILYQPIPFLRK